jgi:hypothetical protein
MRPALGAVLVLSALTVRLAGAQSDSGRSGALQGVWRLELTLDSAGASGPRPTQRIISGEIAFARFGGDSAYGRRAPSTDRFGRFDVDFTPFFGGRVASDVSTTIAAPFDRGLVTEATGELHSRDSVRIELIPRMSHGGLSLHGLFLGDSARGVWRLNAYCCGASGRFALRRESRDSPDIQPPPRRQPPPPLDTTVLGKVRVRMWEVSQGRYVGIEHGLLAGQSSKWAYHTSNDADGWGKAFWLKPGAYAIEIRSYPCRGQFLSLKHAEEHPFTVRVGEVTEVTLRMDLRTVVPRTYYGNPTGERCSP